MVRPPSDDITLMMTGVVPSPRVRVRYVPEAGLGNKGRASSLFRMGEEATRDAARGMIRRGGGGGAEAGPEREAEVALEEEQGLTQGRTEDQQPEQDGLGEEEGAGRPREKTSGASGGNQWRTSDATHGGRSSSRATTEGIKTGTRTGSRPGGVIRAGTGKGKADGGGGGSVLAHRSALLCAWGRFEVTSGATSPGDSVIPET
jgi:hypothetical protein